MADAMSSALYFTTTHALGPRAPRIGRDQAFGILDGKPLPWWSSASFIHARLAYAAHASINVDRWFALIPEAAQGAALLIVRRVFEESYLGRKRDDRALCNFAIDVASALSRCVYETQDEEIDASIRRRWP